MKDTSYLTATETNQRFSKSASIISAKKIFLESEGDRHTFSDLKVVHAAICSKGAAWISGTGSGYMRV